MINTVSVPISECFEAANTVGTAPSFLRRKFFKAFGKVFLARNTDLVFLLATAIGAFVAV